MFGLAIAVMVASVAMIACSKDDAPAPQEEPEFYTVQLGWGGEIVDIAYEPLDTRAATDDLYGIQVYSKPNNNSTATSWEAYAYGLFDDPTNISIDLASGNKYKFVAVMAVDGKDRDTDEDFYSETHYKPPFHSFEYSYNYGFTYSTKKGFDYVYDTGIAYFEVESFYGEIENFVPSNSNTEATIPMKRVSFGAKFIAEGALAKSGVLEIGLEDNNHRPISLTLTDRDDSISKIFTFRSMESAWNNDDYKETISVSFKWIRPDGTELQIGTFPITFKRNTTTVVTIKMENDVVEGDQTGGVGFSIASSEKGPMPENEDNSVTIVDGEVETGE